MNTETPIWVVEFRNLKTGRCSARRWHSTAEAARKHAEQADYPYSATITKIYGNTP